LDRYFHTIREDNLKIIALSVLLICFKSAHALEKEVAKAIGEVLKVPSNFNPTKNAKDRLIKGKLLFDKDGFDYPLKNKEMLLVKENIVIDKTFSSLDGDFQFYGSYHKGVYYLQSLDCLMKITVEEAKTENLKFKCPTK